MSASSLDTINECLKKCNEKFNLETPLQVVYTDAGISEEKEETVNLEEGRDYDDTQE